MPGAPVGTGFVQGTVKFNHCLKDRNEQDETLVWFHFLANLCFLEVAKAGKGREREKRRERPDVELLNPNGSFFREFFLEAKLRRDGFSGAGARGRTWCPNAPGRPGDKQVYHKLLSFKSTSRAGLINLGPVVENRIGPNRILAAEKTSVLKINSEESRCTSSISCN